ncbi:LOW QUALITY PROTEIN: ribosomal RNA-processing protein 8 [Rhynochetos jubatus]
MFAEGEGSDGARPGARSAAEGPGRPTGRRAPGGGGGEPGQPRATGTGAGAERAAAERAQGKERRPAGQEPAAAPSGRAAALRARMEQRLLGARFRYLNEQLYTCTSREAARLFRTDPEAARLYHRGFARQVARWPENPPRIIRYLRRRPASLVVADFGCGDCGLARAVKNRVHCFDLAPLSPRVTVCDMAQVPLAAGAVDVAVFCLALMGTNLRDILGEANRVLPGGTLLVAEVASRFGDTRAFLTALARLGFRCVSKDLSSRFFYLFEFLKSGPPGPHPGPGLRLRPCRYKRR